MEQRIDIMSASPGALKAMLGLATFLHNCGLDKHEHRISHDAGNISAVCQRRAASGGAMN